LDHFCASRTDKILLKILKNKGGLKLSHIVEEMIAPRAHHDGLPDGASDAIAPAIQLGEEGNRTINFRVPPRGQAAGWVAPINGERRRTLSQDWRQTEV
jgi:hypothetical protein